GGDKKGSGYLEKHGDKGGHGNGSKPSGGIHTGGGAMAMVVSDEGSYGDEEGSGDGSGDGSDYGSGDGSGDGSDYGSEDGSGYGKHGGDKKGSGYLEKHGGDKKGSGYLEKHGDKGGHGNGSKPSGGIHTGGGGTAMTADSGLAAGSALLIGGLGVGAYKMRRRQATGGAVA
ncbi:hypothetical protein ACFRCW_23375, partial [Streptomyces sp. NPDC056653]|uniref:hypothetical protein n=1 Tax=Streptomyces sp. NPDC056653 TaxID=3345894 RepID=UPI0036C40551